MHNVNQPAGGNLVMQAGNNGGQIILQAGNGGGCGSGGQVLISAGIGAAPTWEEPKLEKDDGTIWFTTRPCAGHFNTGGFYLGRMELPSRLNRFWAKLWLKWEWTEERSDRAMQVIADRRLRAVELC